MMHILVLLLAWEAFIYVSNSWPTISLVPYDYEGVSLIYFAFHVYYHNPRVI